MKQILLMIGLVALVGCGKEESVDVEPDVNGAGEDSISKPKVDLAKHERFLWEFEAGLSVASSPATGSDGTVYVGSNDNNLHAFNSDGTSKWTFPTGNWVDSTPAIGPDGTVYVGSWDNKVYAINPTDGTELWSFPTSSSVTASPAIGSDGRIYFGSKDYFFYV